MASLSAKEAADAVGMTKAGLLKAVRNGKVSAQKDRNGEWRIDTAELFRAYPPVNQDTPPGYHTVDAGNHHKDTGLQAEIEGLRALVETLQSERDDLRRRLDQESEERRAVSRMLTDQRAQEARRGIWSRLLGR